MTIWIISDTHFGHEAMLKFTYADADGVNHPVRPGFASVGEMDEMMIARWNERVRISDHVYHLGDVAMKKEPIERILPRLNGHKRLVRGNHDIFRTALYYNHFDEIHGVRVFEGLVLTHIPIHTSCLGRFKANVHGHIHERPSFGPRYVNVCVEKTDYYPLSLEEVRAQVEQ